MVTSRSHPPQGKHGYMLPFPGGMRRKFRQWRHFSASSVHLFRYCGFWKVFEIKSFSVKHTSQVFPSFTYGVAVLRLISQCLVLGSILLRVKFVATVPEREVVLVPPFFKVCSTSNIFLLLPSSSDSCLVYHILLVAVVFYGAFELVSSLAVAALVLLICMHFMPLIICFLVHKYDTMMVFLLKMQWRTWFLGNELQKVCTDVRGHS